jgi:hypothetical protein
MSLRGTSSPTACWAPPGASWASGAGEGLAAREGLLMCMGASWRSVLLKLLLLLTLLKLLAADTAELPAVLPPPLLVLPGLKLGGRWLRRGTRCRLLLAAAAGMAAAAAAAAARRLAAARAAAMGVGTERAWLPVLLLALTAALLPGLLAWQRGGAVDGSAAMARGSNGSSGWWSAAAADGGGGLTSFTTTAPR